MPLIVFKVNKNKIIQQKFKINKYLTTNCLDFLREKRNEASLLSNTLRRLTRVPRRLERDMVVTECIGRNETSYNVDLFLRIEIYYPVNRSRTGC